MSSPTSSTPFDWPEALQEMRRALVAVVAERENGERARAALAELNAWKSATSEEIARVAGGADFAAWSGVVEVFSVQAAHTLRAISAAVIKAAPHLQPNVLRGLIGAAVCDIALFPLFPGANRIRADRSDVEIETVLAADFHTAVLRAVASAEEVAKGSDGNPAVTALLPSTEPLTPDEIANPFSFWGVRSGKGQSVARTEAEVGFAELCASRRSSNDLQRNFDQLAETSPDAVLAALRIRGINAMVSAGIIDLTETERSRVAELTAVAAPATNPATAEAIAGAPLGRDGAAG